MMLFITLLFLATCCLLVAWWLRRVRLLRVTHNIPRISGQLPILGCAHRLIGTNQHIFEFIKSISAEINDLRGVGSAWLGPTVFCIGITDPDLSIVIANSCMDKPYFYSWAKPFLGEGLGTSGGNVWKHHRKLLNPAFNQNVLNGFLQIFNQQSKRLVTEFQKYVGSGEFVPRTPIAKNALETICQTAMGLPQNKISIADNIYQEAVEKFLNIVLQRMSSIWKHPQIIYDFTFLKREETHYNKIFHNVSSNVLEKSKKEAQENKKQNNKTNSKFKPFIELLLEESKNGQLTDEEIRDEVNTMVAAGYETTTTTLVLTLIMVGSHNDVQEKIYEELQNTFGNTDCDVTKEDLPKLVYLEAVIKECLRYHPALPIIARSTNKDVQIGDITFPAGSELFLSIWGINRHPCWGPDRNEFVPDRWLSPDTLPCNPNAFAAFSIGKRNCIGKAYAMMSMKIALAHILRKYRVKADHSKLKFDFDFVLKPVTGNTISLELR